MFYTNSLSVLCVIQHTTAGTTLFISQLIETFPTNATYCVFFENDPPALLAASAMFT